MNVNFLIQLEWPLIVVYSILGVCLALIVAFILTVVIKRNDNLFLNNKCPSNLSVTIDVKDNTVLIFSKRRLAGVSNFSINQYLEFFTENSKAKIEELVNKVRLHLIDDIPQSIEVNCAHNNHGKKYFFSVICVNSINIEQNIIHLTQYFYNKIPRLEGIELKHENKIKSMYNVPENVIRNRFISSGTKGTSILFRFQFFASIKTEDISTMIFYSLINIISKFMNQNRVLVIGKHHDLVLHDFKIGKRIKTFKLVNDIKKEFDKFIEMNGAEKQINFSIAICEHKFYPRDYNKVMKALNQTANEAFIKKRNFLFYENSNKEEYYFDQSYRTEVQKIIESHSMKYYFMPIVNTSNCEIIGYLSKVTPVSTIFNEINEVKNYAYKLALSKEMFSENSKHLLSKFINEAGSAKDTKYLFYSLKYHEISYANFLLGYILSSRKTNLVLSFNETDLLKSLDRNLDPTEQFKKLISKGYKLALEITLKTLELPDILYSIFDYFIFDVKFFEEHFDDISHSSLTLKRSIEKILKFKKNVIVSSVNSWNDYELRIQENLKYLAGDIISPYSEMILPINKKTLDKMKKIKKRG